LVDWLWFASLGFGAVFSTVWRAKLAVFGLAAGGAAACCLANGLAAARTHAPRIRRLRVVRSDWGHGEGGRGMPDLFEVPLDELPWSLISIAGAAVLGLFVGLTQAGNWERFLKWWYAEPFGHTDPLFARDLAFYVFTVPAYGALLDWAFLTL